MAFLALMGLTIAYEVSRIAPLVKGLTKTSIRGLAQSGSAPALGAGCRGFKSLHPDHFNIVNKSI